VPSSGIAAFTGSVVVAHSRVRMSLIRVFG
jgi:hypothetical protein